MQARNIRIKRRILSRLKFDQEFQYGKEFGNRYGKNKDSCRARFCTRRFGHNRYQRERTERLFRPLLVTSNDNKYDILITVEGGGMNGQAAACLHGISRALVQIDQDSRTALKANGYLTRDSRMPERKKYGQRGARRRFQFSKR